MTSSEVHTNALLATALAAHEVGICAIPASSDGKKRPGPERWEQFHTARPTLEWINKWFTDPRVSGLGFVCGEVSGGLEMLELEGRAVAAGLDEAFYDVAVAAGIGDVLLRIERGYVERTPSGGVHYLYRCPGHVERSTPLARRIGSNGRPEVLLETRGEKGFVIVSPSNGRTHPSGGAWALQGGSLATIATVTPDERRGLLDVARALDQMPPKDDAPQVWRAPVTRPPGDVTRPGDDFMARTTWAEILEPEGWVHVFDRGVESYWRRPGKTWGTSATTNYAGADRLLVFTSSTTFATADERSYDKLGAYAHLHHGDRIRDAVRALGEAGYGDDLAQARADDLHRLIGGARASVQNRTLDPEAGPAGVPDGTPDPPPAHAPTTARHVDLTAAASGERGDPPQFLRRADGVALIYPGRVSWLSGETGTGKTWIALAPVAEVLDAAGRFLFIDYEDDEHGFVERLRALGIPDDVITDDTRVRYVALHEALADGQGHPRPAAVDFATELAWCPTYAVLDGVTEALAIEGLDPNSGPDIATWMLRIPRALAAMGAAVVAIDHVAKVRDGATRYAIGSVHKLNGVDGAAFIAESIRPVGRPITADPIEGLTRLMLAKDRRGWLTGHAGIGEAIADVQLTAYPDGGMSIHLVSPGAAPGEATSAHAIRIAEHLTMWPGSTKNALRDLGSSTAIDGTLKAMIQAGEVTVTPKGNAHHHTLTDIGMARYGELDR